MAESPRRYTEDEAREPARAAGWDVREGALERTWKLEDFSEAVNFVNRLALVAESHDHHPDIGISYNQVTLRLWTHSADAITEKDLHLARELSNLD